MKLYVGNISWNATNECLEKAFSEFGAVKSAEIICDRQTKRPRGFAFVVMEDEAAGRKAIDGMNGRDHMGRPLVVSEARTKSPFPDGDRDSRRGGSRPRRDRGGDRGDRRR